MEVGAVGRFHCLDHGLLALKLPKVQAKLFKSRDVTIHFNQSEALWDRRQDVVSSRKLENLATHTMPAETLFAKERAFCVEIWYDFYRRA